MHAPASPFYPDSAATELFIHHPVPLWVYDRSTLAFLAVNDAATAQYGYSRDQFLEMRLVDLLPEITDADLRALVDHPGRRRLWRHTGIRRHRKADGTLIDAEITAHDLIFEGRPAAAMAAYDVTRLLAAEQAAREAEQRLNDAQALARIGSWHLDLATEAVIWSDQMFEIAALPRTHGAPSFAIQEHLFSPADWQRLMAAVDNARATGEPFELQLDMVRPDGSRRTIVWRGAAMRDISGVITELHGTAQDITEQHLAQEELRAAARLDAVGRLAGGIAHDFNNLLVAINGFAELALGSVGEGDPLADDLREILRAGNRAAALTAQLLAFSRRQVLQPDSVNLNDVIQSLTPMLRRLLGDDIVLEIDCDAQLPNVRVDTTQLDQVLMNLVVNARDAMPIGGTLRIATSTAGFPPAQLPPPLAADAIVVITVSDTGEGMDEQTLAQIFEPFFTAPPAGGGTGLGLAAVYGFVRQSGGAIVVESAPGEGTTFRIALPQDRQTAAAPADRRPTPAAESATILITDDEESVRTLVRRVLLAAGYRVLTAETPEAAIDICRSYAGTIDLLLTDVIMPQMSGPELAEAVRQLRPDLPVLFMSGYTGDARGRLVDASAPLLQKPFTAARLSEAVRDALKKI